MLGVLACGGVVDLPSAQAGVLDATKPMPFAIQRSIVVNIKQIALVNSHTAVRVVPFSGAGTITLPEIVAAVRDPTWIAEPQPGTVLLRAALVQARGTTLSVQSPTVKAVLLATGLDVFLGGEGATATFAGVTVSSWNRPPGPRPQP